MTNILEKICAEKRNHVERLKAAKPFVVIDAEARRAPSPRGFAKALEAKMRAGEIGLITEIKKASPSAGLIRPDFSPSSIARDYAEAGAACLSVLTDKPYFQGRNEDLVAARAACALPILRKDFMLDVWQVAEARAMGADCILLIMAALDDKGGAQLHEVAAGYGMDVLIEVHNKVELDRALQFPSTLIGINNRDLSSLKVDLAVTEELTPWVPKSHILVSESGISTPSDIARLRKAGAHCFLIGEALLKKKDVKAALKALTTQAP